MTNIFDDWPPEKQDDGRNWSKAKLSILKLLWPMEWVEGSVIFNEIKQTYYDRRIRELRENGWQIKTHKSGQKYKLISHKKLQGSTRKYPNAQLKREVWHKDKGVCKICNSSDKNIQYDHKVPFERQGLTNLENLQLLCRNCNVDKRGACKRCNLKSCNGCPYAFPELYESRFVLFLDKTTSEKLKKKSEAKGISITELASEILSLHFDN